MDDEKMQLKEKQNKHSSFLLLGSIFVIATCGLIYELLAGTLASYLLGDSITQFSTIIGTYLFAMGIGSFLSRYFQKDLITNFIRIELLIGLIGGFSTAFLFLVFEWTASFRLILYGQVLLTGILVGLEIPILMRILKDKYSFKDLVSQVFTFDYIGALLASVLFPLLFVPQLGLIRTALFFGIFNVLVALIALYFLGKSIRNTRLLYLTALLILVAQIVAFVYAQNILRFSEASSYPHSISYTKTTPYQRIVLTRKKDELRLYLNGNLQFSSRDEYRYHEALVHPALASLKSPKDVLVMGGGDGLAVREILKYPTVEHIDLVDLDPAMTQLFSSHQALISLNKSALFDPRVTVANKDAFQWAKKQSKKYDFIVVDFPDPSNFSLGKLYSHRFFKELNKLLKADGLLVIQSTSPLVARQSYWSIVHTLDFSGFTTKPYHAYVPSFGEWGYVIAGKSAYQRPKTFMAGLKFINTKSLDALFDFPPDMSEVPAKVNRLNEQALVYYFAKEWAKYE